MQKQKKKSGVVLTQKLFTKVLKNGIKEMMKKVSLSSVLLLALVTPFIMTYRLGPGETPYWLFSSIFLLCLAYLVIDVLSLGERIYFTIKHYLLYIIILTVIGSAFISAIIVRHQTHPIYMIHDIVLQQEAAIRFLLDGKNPYSTTYFGTFLEQWHYSQTEKNPALYHFVMQPFYLYFALPFYFLSNHTIGYFDGRIPLLLLFFVALLLPLFLVKDKEKRLILITLLAFNPAMLPYTLEGRSDIFMFSFLFLAWYFLQKHKFIVASITMAIAFGIKQSVWPILPFYLFYLYLVIKNKQKLTIAISVFFATFIAILLPFLLWDSKSFLESTVYYLSGNTPHSYPISGYGLGMLLRDVGVIKDVKQYFPFIYFQAVICVPLLIVLSLSLKKNPTVSKLIFTYGIFLFVYW